MNAPEPPSFDLQSHSRYSDGALTPTGVVTAAAAAGVQLLALTDHDSVDGVAEAARAAASQGIDLVPATEISAIDEGRQDLHILGYLIDPEHRPLLEALERSRGDREVRARKAIEALRGLGFAVNTAPLKDRLARGESVGRPHIAQAVVSCPENRERLQAAGLLEPSAFLVEYLIEGRPAFVERSAPSVADAIGLIHRAGGAAVWAHPFWDIAAPERVLSTLERFRELGIDGVEAFYATHTEPQTRLLAQRAQELGMLTTGSSDFHGPEHKTFHRFRAFSTYGLEPVLGPIAARR
ncbi:MAG: PHP domain-containing protein [Solirubrobacteraceae bacterium]